MTKTKMMQSKQPKKAKAKRRKTALPLGTIIEKRGPTPGSRFFMTALLSVADPAKPEDTPARR